MKVLIVEDESSQQKILLRYLEPLATCVVVADGNEAVGVFEQALSGEEPFDLISLDIMLPGRSGHSVLKHIRELEESIGLTRAEGVKVVVATSLEDAANVLGAFKIGCESYVVKPIDRNKLYHELRKLGLLEENLH